MDEALAGIDQRLGEQPAVILKKLALAVIKTVTEMDEVHNVSRYLTSLSVHCTDAGTFELEIIDKDCQEDLAAIARDTAAELDAANNYGYHKPLRPIDVGPGQLRAISSATGKD